MKNELIGILNKYGYSVLLQGSLAADEQYPDSFFTFWNDETTDGAHYDNQPVSYIWNFTVYFYSTDPVKVNTVLRAAAKDLRAAGWIMSGVGYDVPTDEPTHTGRAIDITYIER